MRASLISKSKFLSLVLRHDPGAIGLALDQNGWADVDELLFKAAARGRAITRAELTEIVETNEKKRYELDVVRWRIRANQGHSIEVDLELAPTVPPEELFHGSATRNRDSIMTHGLTRAGRQHVHLSADIATARTVGARHGAPVVFRVASGDMSRKGHAFFISKNHVWLTDAVLPEHLREV
jgi:putative RNA 2'-phosphotransferase